MDLNFDICSLEWRLLEKIQVRANLNPVLEGASRALFFTIKSFLQWNIFVKRHSVIFLVGTHNQYLSLKNVAEKTRGGYVLGFHNYSAPDLDARLPSGLFYIFGWLVFPISLFNLLNIENRYQRTALIKRLERLVVSGSSIFVWKLLLFIWKPRAIVISNDHNHWTRSAMRAASKVGVRTIYIPHAYTSDTFPALECSVSFLDSETQRDLYGQNNTLAGTDVRITGAVRYEKKVKKPQRNELPPLRGVFICFNELDSTDFIVSILGEIANKLLNKYQIFVKPHPADRDRFDTIQDLCRRLLLNYVEPHDDIHNYSDKTQVLLGGVTGAHIDALMYGMLPLSLSSWYEDDYYGLLREKAVLCLTELSDLPQCYQKFGTALYSIAQRFNYHLVDLDTLPSQTIADYLNDIPQVER